MSFAAWVGLSFILLPMFAVFMYAVVLPQVRKLRWPLISRKAYETKIAEYETRLHDIERHFVTKRDPATGQVTETLADRVQKKWKPKRVTWQQTRAWLEATDDGRRKDAQPWGVGAQHGINLASPKETKEAEKPVEAKN